jgi:AraC-like DNA-binding protein
MGTSSERRASVVMIFSGGHAAVGVPMLGNCVLSQDGREVVLTPGDFAVVDTSRPYELAFDGTHRVLVGTMPRELGHMRREDLSRVTVRRVSSSHVLRRAVASPSRDNMGRQMERDELVPSTQLSDAVLDVLAAGLADLMRNKSALQPDSHRPVLLRQIHRYIEQNLSDPQLSPRSIAAAHHISVRYLQKMFQSQGTTVNGWIRDRRLDKCRCELADHRYSNRSIGAIGARWNLSPASYFSRIFRETYGFTPSELRAKARAA